MKPLTKLQLITIATLCSKLGVSAEQKIAMVSGFSAGRTTTSKELYQEEAAALIRHLKTLDPDEAKAEVMRRKIISMAHELGWHIKGSGKSEKIDMLRLDLWCKKFGYGKKGINAYTAKELPKLVTQFEQGPYAHSINRK